MDVIAVIIQLNLLPKVLNIIVKNLPSCSVWSLDLRGSCSSLWFETSVLFLFPSSVWCRLSLVLSLTRSHMEIITITVVVFSSVRPDHCQNEVTRISFYFDGSSNL